MVSLGVQVGDVDVEEGGEDPGQAEDGEGRDDVAGEVTRRGQTGPPGWRGLQERILGERRQHGVVSLVESLALLRGAARAGGASRTRGAPR